MNHLLDHVMTFQQEQQHNIQLLLLHNIYFHYSFLQMDCLKNILCFLLMIRLLYATLDQIYMLDILHL